MYLQLIIIKLFYRNNKLVNNYFKRCVNHHKLSQCFGRKYLSFNFKNSYLNKNSLIGITFLLYRFFILHIYENVAMNI